MIRCPRCKKEVSELDEKCKYCGLDFSRYEEAKLKRESKNIEENYVTGYNVFIIILVIVLFFGGIFIAQDNTNILLTLWGVGIVSIVIVNMLKDIINELRKMNAKIK